MVIYYDHDHYDDDDGYLVGGAWRKYFCKRLSRWVVVEAKTTVSPLSEGDGDDKYDMRA